MIVPRTATPLVQGADGAWQRLPSRPLADFRAERAYVLLGGPGSGKTTTFAEEAKARPDGLDITARRFLTRDLDRHREWSTKTLFIDGLDEVRAERGASSQPLADVLGRLEQLDFPAVRVSCRIADWTAADRVDFAKDYSGVRILLLDPLTACDVSAILEAQECSADALVATLHDNGIDHLLANPLMLRLLIDSSPDADVPESKAVVLEKACQTMARERNTQHQATEDRLPDNATSGAVVSAAGQLFTLSLLAGKVFISRHRPETGDPDDCLFLDDVQGDRGVLSRALQSKLFSGTAPGQITPVHPQVAEYLAARYLAKAIDHGRVPAARVLALISGPDTSVVPTLRGIAAWLATFVPIARRRLIKSDPAGVLAYGDATGFADHDKELLLTCLATQDDTALDFWSLSDLAVGGLVGPATTRIVRRYMATSDRSETAQRAMALFFRGVAARHASGLDITIEELLELASEPSWSSRVRSTALVAAIAMARGCNTTTPLTAFLNDIRSGEVPDPDNKLRGLLLHDLYPDIISPDRIWDYFPNDSGTGTIGVNESFWNLLAEPGQSTSDDVPRLLDSLSKHRDRIGDLGFLAETAARLLERGLHEHGDRVPADRMYDWIEAVAWDSRSEEWRSLSDPMIDEGVDDRWAPRPLFVQPWLAERPDTQLALLAEFCRRRTTPDFLCQFNAFERMVCSKAYPADYRRWCLEHALNTVNNKPEVARVLLGRAPASGGRETALHRSREAVIENISHPVLAGYALELGAREEQLGSIIARQRHRQSQQNRHLANAVHTHAKALMSGMGPLGILDELAQAYLGAGQYRSRQPQEPMDRLRLALADDAEATTTALRALRLVVSRDDLPSARRILELDENNQRSRLVYPLLVAVAEADAKGEDICARDDDMIERSLVCCAVVPLENQRMPAWVDKLLECRPEFVANALILVGKSQIRRDTWNGEHLESLAVKGRYATFASETALRLARRWPSRCNGSQAGALQFALQIVLRHVPNNRDFMDRVLALVKRKSEVAGMDVKQEATWLGVGLQLAVNKQHVDRVIAFLDGGKPVRLWHLVEFLARLDDDESGGPVSEDAETLGALVQAVASRCTPWSWRGGDPSSGFVTTQDSAELAAEKLVKVWTGILAQDPDEATGVALKYLVEDPRFASWRHIAGPKYGDWQIARRVDEYKVPSVREVQETLSGGAPANRGDLVALLVNKLEELADEIRHGDTDDWKQYWNVDHHGRATEPRPENPCRDALLSDLRLRLPEGVDAQPEGHYAEDKRSDIRVACRSYAIPVEVKKNSHSQLWSAIETQLIAKYTRDPRSSGFGIYVVLWFGAEHTTVVPPCGHHPKPSTPADLKRCLEEGLTKERLRMVKVVVIDVSCPAPPL